MTDAFLTRFSPKDKIKVLQIFFNSLKPGGMLLTTVRMPKKEETVIGQQKEADDELRKRFPGAVIDEYRRLAINSKIKPYENDDDLLFDAISYANTMSSNHARPKEDKFMRVWMPQTDALPGNGIGYLLVSKEGKIGFEQAQALRSPNIVTDITPREYLLIKASKAK